jgi:hypothetical protein
MIALRHAGLTFRGVARNRFGKIIPATAAADSFAFETLDEPPLESRGAACAVLCPPNAATGRFEKS